jgi:hypothetical protein
MPGNMNKINGRKREALARLPWGRTHGQGLTLVGAEARSGLFIAAVNATMS